MNRGDVQSKNLPPARSSSAATQVSPRLPARQRTGHRAGTQTPHATVHSAPASTFSQRQLQRSGNSGHKPRPVRPKASTAAQGFFFRLQAPAKLPPAQSDPHATGRLLLLSSAPPPLLCPAALRQPRTCQQDLQASQGIQRHLTPRGALQCRSSDLLCASSASPAVSSTQLKSPSPPKVVRPPLEDYPPLALRPPGSKPPPPALTHTTRPRGPRRPQELQGPQEPRPDPAAEGPFHQGGRPPGYPPAPGANKPPGASQLGCIDRRAKSSSASTNNRPPPQQTWSRGPQEPALQSSTPCIAVRGNKRRNGPRPGRASQSDGHLARQPGHAPPKYRL
ncbi:hypothetical protein NDU88_008256 [Pleurodeles waltl]|uniref:Uncharacterized protein n=1 Tax=Pleurodeles waltl TaxID=8319 RepID=A0AAV7RRT0_PLEWA|nr:hypothetical protein NDU88_008256 [Pleurodeles waltl]